MYAHDEQMNWRQPGFKPFFGMAQQLQGMMSPPAQRARRGDVRAAILQLLREEPMHGYQIIGELTERSGGAWSPSAGSVYPTLQQLADERLVVAETVGGKKVYHLTDAGIAAAERYGERPSPWDEAADTPVNGTGYHRAAYRLVQAIVQVGTSGSPRQMAAGVEILSEARKRLYALLAED
ncbi:PadR family transcriptional regulator [Flaviflexus huanghaiensis]|uniref:PadR family transcriptional regulator n=1 Tax=Flaviflexus huanghaiensis TaxID=1111473 RepID=UPI0015FB37EF|nr:PadR family transcriptional regulator [Flaviflexus huanghaiensis]